MGNKLLKVAVVMALAMASTAGASWLSGMLVINGNIASTGSAGQTTETWSFTPTTAVIVPGDNTTISTTWDNQDGDHLYEFVYADNVASTNASCNYQPGIDYIYAISVNGQTRAPPFNATLTSGINDIAITYTGDINMCPLAGTMNINATRQ